MNTAGFNFPSDTIIDPNYTFWMLAINGSLF